MVSAPLPLRICGHCGNLRQVWIEDPSVIRPHSLPPKSQGASLRLCPGSRKPPVPVPQPVIHRLPDESSTDSYLPCCGRTPAQCQPQDSFTSQPDAVTCPGALAPS